MILIIVQVVIQSCSSDSNNPMKSARLQNGECDDTFSRQIWNLYLKNSIREKRTFYPELLPQKFTTYNGRSVKNTLEHS